MAGRCGIAENLVSENLKKFVDGMESFGTEERHENCAGNRDRADCENCAESVWSLLTRWRGVKETIDTLGKILIHAGRAAGNQRRAKRRHARGGAHLRDMDERSGERQ